MLPGHPFPANRSAEWQSGYLYLRGRSLVLDSARWRDSEVRQIHPGDAGSLPYMLRPFSDARRHALGGTPSPPASDTLAPLSPMLRRLLARAVPDSATFPALKTIAMANILVVGPGLLVLAGS